MLKLLLHIPLIRHWLSKRLIRLRANEQEFIGLCNRFYAMAVVPNLCALCAEGKIDSETFLSPAYYRYVAEKMFGRKVKGIVSQLKVERVKLRTVQDLSLIMLTIPSTGNIGEAQYIALVKDLKNDVNSYTLEYSANGIMKICCWDNKIHMNFGTAKDKKDFVLQIIRLHSNKENNKEVNNQMPGKFDELDLKHRLSKEIGVRYEMLDFYMKKFQDKVHMEMSGIDTSGIDSDIEDVDEWLRYCNWEIKQAMSRMNPQEIEQSKDLFYSYIGREKR